MILILQPIAKYRHPLNQDSLDRYRAEGTHRTHIVTVTGCSDISLARCLLAERAYQAVRELRPHAVLWLDSDIVFEPDVVDDHYYHALREGVPIAGEYVQRIKPALAATSYSLPDVDYPGHLRPVVSGMGALMMRTSLFIAQYESSPKLSGGMGRAVCCTHLRKMTGDTDTVTMVSEDYSYCLTFFERGLGAPHKGVFNLVPAINYGHVAEKVLVNS